MAVDRGPLHGIHRDPGAGAPGGRRLCAGLSVSLHVRCRRKALGLQGSVQLGRGPQALARARAAQRGDGRALPGELRQVPGSCMTFSPLFHAGAGPLESRLWSALAEINDPEMPVNLVDLGLIYGLTVDDGRVFVSRRSPPWSCLPDAVSLGDHSTRYLA